MTEQRTLEDGRAWLLARLERAAHPLDGLDPEAAKKTIEHLGGLEPEAWAEAWGALADRFAAEAEAARDPAAQRVAWVQAYQASFLGVATRCRTIR